jgi:hypothetical protein
LFFVVTQASHAMAAYCTSVVHAKDLVPRISWSNVERLVDSFMELSALCRRNKLTVQLGALFGRRCEPHVSMFVTPPPHSHAPSICTARSRWG